MSDQVAELRAELEALVERGPDYDSLDHNDAVHDYEQDVDALEGELDRLACERAGTHRMVYQGRTSEEGDPPGSSRDVMACESCGHRSVSIYAF
jgi:hypothetical protein